MFITNNQALFHLWEKETLVKCKKVSKYYVEEGLQNSVLLSMNLLTAPIVKKRHMLGGILFIFLENVLGQS